ncbi:thrombospondin type 3 repeat-containing protein [bacterium]|nr:thrombospondin type 3 repeat-containing protein [bacterium]
MNSSCEENNNIEAKLVSFINIKYDPDVDGCESCEHRKDELEGLDVGEEIGGYDLRLVVLHNIDQLVGVEHHSVLHFATGDYDKDGVKDINDNCPFDANDDQQDLDGDYFGDACDRDIDGD